MLSNNNNNAKKIKSIASLCMYLALLFVMHADICNAGDSSTYQPSRDIQEYPDGSPEAVLVTFVEKADLESGAHREDDERLWLFWRLTELRRVQDHNQRLIIHGYRISGKRKMETGDVIVGLKLDVRAIRISECDPNEFEGISYQRNNCNWRERIVRIRDTATGSESITNLSRTRHFVGRVFGEGKNNITTSILQRVPGTYVIPRTKREWVFDVRLVKKNGRWLIADDSVPMKLTYIDDEIKTYRRAVEDGTKIKALCEGISMTGGDQSYRGYKYGPKQCVQSLNEYTSDIATLKMLESAKENNK